MRNPWGGTCSVRRGNELIAESEDDVITFPTAKGTRYLLLPAGTSSPDSIRVSTPPLTAPSSYSFELPNGEAAEATLRRKVS